MLPSGGSYQAHGRSQTPPPPLPQQGNRILFYGTEPSKHCVIILTKFILFYFIFINTLIVKALYEYTATIEEEFDFQAGDVIAVTATPDDGWWSGELLDEARRVEGRNVFPSNFVCLF